MMASIEDSTERSYSTGLAAYELFCDNFDVPLDARFPPTVGYLLAFVTYIKDRRGILASTARSYVTAVRSICTDMALDVSAFDDPALLRLFKGMKRHEAEERIACDDEPAPPRVPITVDYLPSMLAGAKSKAARMAAAASVAGVVGLFRGGEITLKSTDKYPLVRRRDVAIIRGFGVRIRLRKSKTDYFRRGVTVNLASNGSVICPLHWILLAMDLASDKSLDAALFQELDGSPLKRDTLLKWVRKAAIRAGLPASRVGTHSLRSGGATTLARLGYEDSTIQTLGRWAPQSYQRYVHLSDGDFVAISAAMAGLATSRGENLSVEH
jgi:hypothetical protein